MISEESRKCFGMAIRYYRVRAGIKASSLSQSFNYRSSQFVSNWERGLSLPPKKVLPQLAYLLNCQQSEFIDIWCHLTRRDLCILFGLPVPCIISISSVLPAEIVDQIKVNPSFDVEALNSNMFN